MLMLFLTVAMVHIVALMSPGPDFFFVSQTAVSRSRKEAMMGVLGITCGVIDAPRDKCTLSCAINGIHAAFHYLKKNYISGCVMTVPTG